MNLQHRTCTPVFYPYVLVLCSLLPPLVIFILPIDKYSPVLSRHSIMLLLFALWSEYSFCTCSMIHMLTLIPSLRLLPLCTRYSIHHALIIRTVDLRLSPLCIRTIGGAFAAPPAQTTCIVIICQIENWEWIQYAERKYLRYVEKYICKIQYSSYLWYSYMCPYTSLWRTSWKC